MATSNHDAPQPLLHSVAIVGGGVAGLSCAHALLEIQSSREASISSVSSSLPPVVLEASDRLGGRVRGLPLSVDGVDVSLDLGAAW